MSVISASLSPNAQADDVIRALGLLCTPWQWKQGDAIRRSEAWFERQYNGATAVSFNSGRSALLALLWAFGIGKGDEVIIQAFTCVAVPNSVRWRGAVTRYADIDKTYNLDPDDLEKKITSKTKAVVVQHTFGVPARMGRIMEIIKKHKLILIEDCAHSLGASYEGKKVGSFGHGTFFSFGRDKVLSSVWGGMAVIGPECSAEGIRLKKYQEELPMPGFFWIFQQLFHPVAFACILASYNVLGIGKVVLVLLQKLGLLSFPVYKEEKRGDRPPGFPARYPNALAHLLVGQLAKLSAYNATRVQIARLYGKIRRGAVYLRFPLEVSNPTALRTAAKRNGILLGSWYHQVIDPAGTDKGKAGYTPGSCPNAERAAAHIINLPTRIGQAQAETIVRLIRLHS